MEFCTWGLPNPKKKGRGLEPCGKRARFMFHGRTWFGKTYKGFLCRTCQKLFGLDLIHKGETVTFFRFRNT